MIYLPTNERIAMIVTLSHQYPDTGEWFDDFECESDSYELARWVSTYIRNDIKFRITPLE